MVVQHNLAAMNSSRMLGITTGKQAKTSEKLSSGYRINRAADDAAGLAISEKMRKQINGLSRASTNAQDGVSSVQTAEGALSEVHSMLQRMNELSVQAANGTNSVEDRDAIQLEISQLSTEIDRVAETTKFNETYLLKGNGKPSRHYPKAHDAGLKGQLVDGATEAQFTIPALQPNDKINIGGVEYTIGSGKEDASNLIQNAMMDADNIGGDTAAAQDSIYEQQRSVRTAAQNRLDAELAKPTVSQDAAAIANYRDQIAAATTAMNAAAAARDTAANRITQEITIDGVTYKAVFKSAVDAAPKPADVYWEDENGVMPSWSELTDVTPVDPGIDISYNGTTLHIMNDEENNGLGDGVDDYDNTIVTDDVAYQYLHRELLAANNIGTTAQAATVNVSIVDGNASFHIQKGFANVTEALSFALHVGSDADLTNKIVVDIETMTAANLGIEGLNVSDETGLAATYAIDAIADALSIVSDQRASLGAIQNRLEHTIANLDNVVENTTDAESRIRDTDMAEAMVEYSKNNILAQAGQAMLAQANSSTEGVLSLLQ